MTQNKVKNETKKNKFIIKQNHWLDQLGHGLVANCMVKISIYLLYKKSV